MLKIIQDNDRKEKYQSYELLIEIELPYWFFWKNTKESVDNFKEGIEEWKKQLDYTFSKINWEELYKYDGKEQREIIYTKKIDIW